MGIIYGPPPWAPPRSISAAATQSISSSRPLFSSLPTTPTSSHDQLHTLPHRSNTTRITGTVIDATPATAIVSSSTANQLNLASHPTASTTPTTTIVINTTQLVSNSDSSANAAVAVVPHPISTTTLNDTPRETATLAKNTITKTTATTSRRISTPHTSPNCVTSGEFFFFFRMRSLTSLPPPTQTHFLSILSILESKNICAKIKSALHGSVVNNSLLLPVKLPTPNDLDLRLASQPLKLQEGISARN